MSLAPLVALLALGQPPVAGPVSVPAEACAKVLAALTKAAAEAQRLPVKPTGDELTARLVRKAAAAAQALPREQRAAAFCLALAVGLDDSETLRGNFLLGRLVKAVESDDQRKARLAVLGRPTLQGRRDWCQHFAVSAGLVVLAGSEASRAAGRLKEQLDLRPGGSGYSLTDLAADEAGLRLAELVLDDPRRLATLADTGDLAGVLPTLKELPDGWSLAEIEKKFGGLADPRFTAELERVRERVRQRPGIAAPP